MQSIATISGKCAMNIETPSGCTPIGEHAWTMELFKHDTPNQYMIEWDVPTIEETEHIGIWTEDNILTDYDGVYSLPKEAVDLLAKADISVPAEFLE